MAAIQARQMRELNPQWRRAWTALDTELADWLTSVGLSGPYVWVGLPLRQEQVTEDLWEMNHFTGMARFHPSSGGLCCCNA